MKMTNDPEDSDFAFSLKYRKGSPVEVQIGDQLSAQPEAMQMRVIGQIMNTIGQRFLTSEMVDDEDDDE